MSALFILMHILICSHPEHSLHKIHKRSVTSSDNSSKQQFVVDYAAVIDYAIFNR